MERISNELKDGSMPEVWIMKFAPINRYTRTGKWGKRILCPNCNHQSIVYHFAWSALGCMHCKGMIEKDEWLVEVK